MTDPRSHMACPRSHKAVLLLLAWLVTIPSVTADSQWSDWYNSDTPGTLPQDGDDETLDSMDTLPCVSSGGVSAVQCRQVNSSASFSDSPTVGGGIVLHVPCNRSGLLCRNRDQVARNLCADYEIRVLCSADLGMTPRVVAAKGSNSTQQQQLGLYNVSSEITTRRDSGSSSNDISTNGGFIAMAAGGSVILPLVCVLIIQLRKSKRLERLRREQALQAAEDLRRSEEQRNGGHDRPPAYEELFGSAAAATTSLVSSATGSLGGSHPTESMSVASGFLSVDSGVGLDGDVSLERVIVTVDGGPAASAAAAASYARGRYAGSQLSLLHGRTSVVSTTSTTSTMLSFDASSAPSSPTMTDAGSPAVAVVSSGAVFTFPPSSSSSASTNGRAATHLRDALPLSEAEENADIDSDTSSRPPGRLEDLGHTSSSSRVSLVVPDGLTPDEVRETRSGAVADRVMPLPTIVVSAESRSRRSSAESSFSQASCSSTDILLPPTTDSPSTSAVRAGPSAVIELSIRGPVSEGQSAVTIGPVSEREDTVEQRQAIEAEARSEGQSALNNGQVTVGRGSRGESAVTVSVAEGQVIGMSGSASSNSHTTTTTVASAATTGTALAPAARAQRRLSLPHNGPPPTYDSPSYSSPLPASAVLYVPSSGRGSNIRSLSTSAAPLLAYLTSSTSSSSTQEDPRADAPPGTPAVTEVVVIVGEPPAVPPPPPTPLPQRPARRFLGMHLSIYDLMAALYQSPDPAAAIPPPSYDDALKILAAKVSKPETNSAQGIQNPSPNQVV